jgi:Cdc6-like AAA superfamily ATPase
VTFLNRLLKRWFGSKARPANNRNPANAYVNGNRRTAPARPKSAAGPVAIESERLPRFRIPTVGRSTERSDIAKARLKLRDAFTPAQPVTERRLFAGRLRVLANLIEIIEERLAHVVVFGERGIGKTSLMHILADLAQESRYRVVRGTCGSGSRFDEIFRTLLRDIPVMFLKSVSPTDQESEAGASLADHLPEGRFNAQELSELLGQITGTRILIILDEYDRLESEEFRQSVAELIKNLSDLAAPVQLIIAGVSANLHELIGYIPSIRRNVIGVPMPKLTKDEVRSLIQIGENASGIRFDKNLTDLVHALSNGSPYMVRLICHHASLIALDEGRLSISQRDIEKSLERMVEEAHARLAFRTAQRADALRMDDDGRLLSVVSRAASTPDGWFGQTELQAYAKNDAERAAATALIEAELTREGLIDQDTSGPEARYRFSDEGMANYLWVMVARQQFRAQRMAKSKQA